MLEKSLALFDPDAFLKLNSALLSSGLTFRIALEDLSLFSPEITVCFINSNNILILCEKPRLKRWNIALYCWAVLSVSCSCLKVV